MENALFTRFLTSDICPHGTHVYFQNAAGQNVQVGETDRSTGLIGGQTLSEFAHASGYAASSRREVLNRMHLTINNETLGMSAWMVRTLANDRAYYAFLREFGVKCIPKYLLRLWLSWRQHYKDGVEVNRGIAFNSSGRGYNWHFPDNHLANIDHIIPRFMGGGDELTNLQAISLASHYKKSMKEIRQAAKLRRFKPRTLVRRNDRYKFRRTRAVNYREVLRGEL
jgi:hypothetical protein